MKVFERDKQMEEDLWQSYKAERGIWTEPMLMALTRGVKGNKWFSLIDKVQLERTLGLAWEKVKSNAGACGVDAITIAHFSKDSQSRLLAVNERLKKGVYRPMPVKRVWIPKPGSADKRPLGIPAVIDRVVQAAIKLVIEPIFENCFHEHSYGFRPGRGSKDALKHVDELLKAGYIHVVDVDIKGYFDTISHERLMAKVREHIADGKVLGIIESFLKQGVIEGTTWTEAEEGTPQGGVISPLLANIYLDELDWLMSKKGYEMVRYADDMVVMCRTEEEAKQALTDMREWMEGASLTLHPEKTRTVDLRGNRAHFDFLGYRFVRSKRGRLIKAVRPKSLRSFKAKIKPRTKRTSGRCMEAIIKDINKSLRGWYGYYKHCDRSVLKDMDGWIRTRLRSIQRKRRGLKGRARGGEHRRWPNRYFEGLGLYSLLEAQAAEIINLRKGATY